MEEIFAFLDLIHTLSPECLDDLRDMVQRLDVKKKQIILKAGQINENLYFIKKGALKCYYYVEEVPVCAWFFFETDTVVSISSFYDQLPSVDYIEPTEDSELYYITKEQYDYLIKNYVEFGFIVSKLIAKYLKQIEDHGRLIRKHRNVESYKLAVEKMPHLINRVSVNDLASWLNMSPESLSRIRGSLGH